ncbi:MULTISPECIES: M1 family metallopeptidase [unclassified Nocardioides]|uniref:M1 family metallopeptidase n=1 Tax=unclassified Nocardioides TaxID=2615069 RepID=UPI000701DB97|nr:MULTISPECIES: M1 family metallopeptidase [unclassified Nocardioides]KQY64524.1 hypothetical protein ASD30_06290 [Nocardioides sp. Root140]KRF18319.1 hypothetical protein ASH02_01815 [Nocardioides sp. Soil796]
MSIGLMRRIALVSAGALALPIGVAAAAPPGAGDPGIGDPYYPLYGNGGYDVAHYDIAVSYDKATDTLAGTTTVTATATDRLRSFDLDFVLPVSSVQVNGKAAGFTAKPHELVVTPRSPLRPGQTMKVRVVYAGQPSSIEVPEYGASPWIQTSTGAAAVGEPEIAAWWYPSNDHPRDKATFDVTVTTPADQEALSNGVLVSNELHGDTRAWHWRESKPMATYLAFFASGQYDITQSTSPAGLPVVTAVASDGGAEGEYAAADLARTPEVVEWASLQWGAYPFDAMGGVAPAADFGFALENQTRPVYTRGFWRGGPNIYVVVHELAHQWYGDSVSVHNWRDIWLNEGFASFTEWLWSEDHGEGTGAELFDEYWDYYQGNDAFWTRVIGDPGAGHEFAGAVYDRGAMTLQALRVRIGDAAFFATMRDWAADHRYGNAEILEFITLAETNSGEDLASFFDAWLYQPTKPEMTPENGFPAGFAGSQRSVTSEKSAPASFTKIQRTHRQLIAAELGR